MIYNSNHLPEWLLLAHEPPTQEISPRRFGLFSRLAVLALLFALELLALSVQFDTGILPQNTGLTKLVRDWGPGVLRGIVAFAVLFLTFAFITARNSLQRISLGLTKAPVSRGLLAGHVCALLTFSALSYLLFGHTRASSQADLVAAAWMATGAFAVTLAGFALVPLKLAVEILRNTRSVWLLALTGSVVACLLINPGRSVWMPVVSLTFSMVRTLLRPFVPGLIANAATLVIGGNKFLVIINPSCSGLEGMGLILVYSAVWLWFFRRECRFPQALLFIPVGLLLMWFLNSVRIAVLVLIGNAGSPRIALGGFHSQAGWIAFNACALGLSLALRRIPWLTTTTRQRSPVETENPAAWYLAPFLMILVAAMVTRATANGFEWLYPLQFFATAAALFYFRRNYAGLDWRIGWVAPIAGGAVFAMWLGLKLITGTASESVTPARLASLSAPAQVTWVVFRTLSATVTVPFAEELAFRGFLLRRLMSPDFVKVTCRGFGLFSIVVSSIAFGILHGHQWLAGTIAGVFYALTLRHRGRMGDAVAAHTITNALLTSWGLLGDQWQFWLWRAILLFSAAHVGFLLNLA